MTFQPVGASKPSPANILLVDDTPSKLLTYEVVLAELGERLIQVSSVEQALGILLREDIALILTDVSMPGIDGFAFASMVREHPRFRSIPIIFVSAIADSDPDRLKGYASGAVDYVTAPIHPELLRAKIKVFMELHRKQRQLNALTNELEERVMQRTAQLEASARQLAASEERYRSLVENANDIVATFDLQFRLTSVNPAIGLLGYTPEELIGQPLSAFIPADQLTMHKDMLRRKLEGEGATRYEMELLSKDQRQRFTLEVSSKLMYDDEGRPAGIHAIARDATERKEFDARQNVLIRELQHRTKNLLAVVQSIVINTLARDPNPEAARDAIIGRLHALARAQEFVASGATSGVPIGALVQAELSAFTHRLTASGEDFVLGGSLAQQFALVIHELATNAAKYGSLSQPEGRLVISWALKHGEEPPQLHFNWKEIGGPAIEKPKMEGFGSQLISAICINGSEWRFTSEGLVFTAVIPLPDLYVATNSDHAEPFGLPGLQQPHRRRG